MHARIACALASRKYPAPLHTSLCTSPANSDPQKAYLLSKKSWEEKTLKTNFFHLYWTFLTTVLNQFQTSESIFQYMAHVRKYSFQMEVWSDLVNLNLFANFIRKHTPPPTPVCICTHTRVCTHARSGLRRTCLTRTSWALWPVNLWLVGFPVCVHVQLESGDNFCDYRDVPAKEKSKVGFSASAKNIYTAPNTLSCSVLKLCFIVI